LVIGIKKTGVTYIYIFSCYGRMGHLVLCKGPQRHIEKMDGRLLPPLWKSWLCHINILSVFRSLWFLCSVLH